MTDLKGAEAEEARAVAIKKLVLDLMKQNGHWNSRAPQNHSI
jgi:hypothetical protein